MIPPEVDLQTEARLLARHLLGAAAPAPPPVLLDRYALAVERLRPRDPAIGAPSVLLRFGLRHPESLPLLDAGAAWLRPGDPLRRRLILLLALLEADPGHARRFLPRTTPRRAAILRLGRRAGRAALSTLAGLALVACLDAYEKIGRGEP